MIPRNSITGPFGLSIAALALAVLFLLFTLPSLVGAVFTAGTGKSKPAEAVTKLMAKHDEALKTYKDRFNGRSPFFKPPPIYVPPPPKKEEGPPPPPPPPPPPVVPPVYGGPSLTAIFGDEAWFKAPTTADKPFTLKVGESEPKSGVKLLSTDAPWTVRVAHKGGEYTVGFNTPMFDPGKTDSYFKASPKLSLPFPGLTILPVPTASAPDTSTPTDAAKDGDDEADEDEKAAPAETAPARLQAHPLDGTQQRHQPERGTEKARNENGESADEDEDSKPAQTQPEHATPPRTPSSQHVQAPPSGSQNVRQTSPAAPK